MTATAHGATGDSTLDDDPVDDTGHLDELAARLGVAARRRPRRVALATTDGTVSALDWTDDGESPEFLFAHGGGLNAHAWDSTLMLLDRPARAVDLPGHGWSTWRDDADYHPATIAAALAEAAPASRPFVLVGHSLGGLTSLMALRRIEPRPAALVLVDIAPSTIARGARPPRGLYEPELSFASREEAVEWAVAQGLGRNRETLAIGIRFNTRRRDDGRFVFRHHLAQLPFDPTRFAQEPDALWTGFDPEVPTVVVQGTRGVVTEQQVDDLRARAPWVRIERVDSGHNVHSQAPEALAAILGSLGDRG